MLNMELSIDIGYIQLVKLARQLPYKYKKKLSREMERDLKQINLEQANLRGVKRKTGAKEPNELQRFLLNGPTMSDEQFDRLRQLRKDFDKWLNQ
ncbi:MAG: hypothetical protein QG657_1758 [Acidobacteriota bacterium]|nr:hypothetical protein [Acidobacteriota bacterium]